MNGSKKGMTAEELRKFILEEHTCHGIDERLYYDIRNREPLIWFVEVWCADGYHTVCILWPEEEHPESREYLKTPDGAIKYARKVMPSRFIEHYRIMGVASTSGAICVNKRTGMEFPEYVSLWEDDWMSGNVLI